VGVQIPFPTSTYRDFSPRIARPALQILANSSSDQDAAVEPLGYISRRAFSACGPMHVHQVATGQVDRGGHVRALFEEDAIAKDDRAIQARGADPNSTMLPTRALHARRPAAADGPGYRALAFWHIRDR
jgi:hypothetical protein